MGRHKTVRADQTKHSLYTEEPVQKFAVKSAATKFMTLCIRFPAAFCETGGDQMNGDK